ncbi:patatin-like phospholipase family protein [Devosia sp. FJ2-5-3]|uniref:patatin-like phospholipase family protein n=1 Tax=Devosia sp. FJ2-5-3 TaxID=2976680 RepID=UPI0023D8BAB3|nr:patatin-like phospholipase family protein [Devosia sp. FJ2-5-3]WEJ57123.1 patatin-like phospholipase family protein [Devosia sp. FJ2-5-3]
MKRLLKLSIIMTVAIALGACSFVAPKRALVPAALADTASIGTSTTLRYWGDDPEFAFSHTRVKAGSDGKVDFLTLSGGGINGAYGAGFLVGWSQSGKRPEFEVVTGISVGAIIAPLAFLGTPYDEKLKLVFSSLTEATNPAADFISAVFGAPSILSNAPLRAAIATVVDERVLTDIAKAHRDGRRLYVGTTNLDAQRPVVWDIGAIANSNLPNRLELVHNIILASAAVPGVFPPILVDVAAQGQAFNELHVDGGVTQQVLLMPGGYGNRGNGTAQLYVIFNGVVEPTRETVQISSVSLLQRAVPTMLKYLGRANLAELASSAKNSGVSYRVTAIPAEFPESSSLFGSPQWLSMLYDYGLQSGKVGAWHHRN